MVVVKVLLVLILLLPRSGELQKAAWVPQETSANLELKEMETGNGEWGPPADVNGEVSVTFHERHPLMQSDRQFSIYIRGRSQFPIWSPSS